MTYCNSSVCRIQWIVYVPTLVAGLPLNLAALWLILFRIQRWTESTVYLTSLVVNDSLLILSLPFKMYAYDRFWALGRGFCSFLENLVFVNIYGSIILIVCISGDRYISLQFPFKSKILRSPRKATLVCLVLWVLVFSATAPVYDLHKDNGTSADVNITCFRGFSDSTWKKLWIITLMETVFLASTVAMVFFSVRVMQVLRNLRRRNPLDEKLRNNKSVKVVLSNLVAFLLCFIPYHVMALIYFLAKNKEADKSVIEPLREMVHITACVSSVNCLTDGICYYLILKESLLSKRLERRRLSTRGNVERPAEEHLLTSKNKTFQMRPQEE